MQFIHWLISLFSDPKPACESCKISDNVPRTDADILHTLASTLTLDEAPIKELIEYRDKTAPGFKPRYWAVADFSKSSNKKRFHVFDIESKSVTSYFVAHGLGSDLDHTGWCLRFSNTPGSKCSSRGIYRASETYISGKFGYACRLDGLQSTNSNVRQRAVVLHGSNYTKDAYVKANGKCGRSEGCLAVSFDYSKDVVDKLKGGSLINVWK